MKAYKDQAFQASMEAGATAVQRSPDDPFVFESVRQQRENAIRAQLYGAAPETISRAVEEANSDLEVQRIAVVASRDPFAALAMTEDSTYLLAYPVWPFIKFDGKSGFRGVRGFPKTNPGHAPQKREERGQALRQVRFMEEGELIVSVKKCFFIFVFFTCKFKINNVFYY